MSSTDIMATGRVIGVDVPSRNTFKVQIGDRVDYAKYVPEKSNSAVSIEAGKTYEMAVITRPSLPSAKVFIVWMKIEDPDLKMRGIVSSADADKELKTDDMVELVWWSSMAPNGGLVSGRSFEVSGGPKFTLDKWETIAASGKVETYTRLTDEPVQDGTFTVRFRLTTGTPGMMCPDGSTRYMNAIPETLGGNYELPVWKWKGSHYTELPNNLWFQKPPSGNWQRISAPPAGMGMQTEDITVQNGTYTVVFRTRYGNTDMVCPDGNSRRVKEIPAELAQMNYKVPVWYLGGFHYVELPGPLWFRMEPNGVWKEISAVPEGVPLGW